MLRTVLTRASWLGLGTAAGQGLILAATPFLARTFGPHEFGLLALLMTVGSISIAVGCLRYDLALPSAEDGDVIGLVRLCSIAALGWAVLVAAASAAVAKAAIFGGSVAEVLGQPLLVGSCAGLAATHQALSALFLRRGQIAAMACLRILQGGGFALLALCTPLGLLWSHALSFGGGAAMLLYAFQNTAGGERSWREAMRNYRVFAQQGLPGALLDVVGYSLCIWTVLAVYGASDSGELSQVQRIVGAPLMLASVSLAQVLLRHTVELRDAPDQLRTLINQLLSLMIIAAVGALIFLAIFGQQLLGWLLGTRWHVTGVAIIAISAAVMVRACVSPMSSLLATFRRFDLALRWQGLYLFSATVLFLIFSHLLNFEHFLVFYAIHEIILYAIYLRIIYSTLRR